VDGTERGNFNAEGDSANVDVKVEWGSSAWFLVEANDATDTVDGRRAIHMRSMMFHQAGRLRNRRGQQTSVYYVTTRLLLCSWTNENEDVR
jgi:hypothetical protein